MTEDFDYLSTLSARVAESSAELARKEAERMDDQWKAHISALREVSEIAVQQGRKVFTLNVAQLSKAQRRALMEKIRVSGKGTLTVKLENESLSSSDDARIVVTIQSVPV
jgi:hypothetical protein